jgi:methyl-accepting chemotaxis protein
MAVSIPIVSEFVNTGIKQAERAFMDIRKQVAQAEGTMGKFKAAGKATFDAVKANAANFALAAAGSFATFALKGADAFQKVALAAGELSDATGLTVEEASRLAEVAGDIGIDAGTIETTIGKMNKELGKSPELFEELGVQIAYTEGGAVDANETFLNVIDRLNGITDPAERARVASELLGKGWQGMSELIAGGSDKLRASLAGVSEQKVIDERELEKARKYRESMDKLRDAGDDLAQSLGEHLIPALTIVAEIAAKGSEALGYLAIGTGEVATAEKMLKEVVDGIQQPYKDYYEARRRAAAQDKYVIEGFEDTTEAVYDLNIAWERMLNTIDQTRQINDVRDSLDEVKQAAMEAFGDPTKIREYDEAVANLIEEIARLATTVQMSNADQNTLKVLVDTGQLERAVELMAIIKTGRGRVTLPQAVQAMTETDLFLGTLGIPGRAMGGPVSAGGTYLVGERGPELLTMGARSGYVTPNHAMGGGGINVTVTSADPNEVVRALQAYVRQSGPVPVNTRAM